MTAFPKNKPHRSREFLAFAKGLPGPCCICWRVNGRKRPAEELHHYGEKGAGQKCSDHEVARICAEHHRRYQGKRRIGFMRAGEIEVLEALESDNVKLLSAWATKLEGDLDLLRSANRGTISGARGEQ